MATYEIEHNISPPTHPTTRSRPDFSTFFSTMALVDTTSVANAHARALPSDIAAAHRGAAEAYALMVRGRAGERSERDEGEDGNTDGGGEGDAGNERLLRELIEGLMRDARDPPREVRGVGDGFLDELERVPPKNLTQSDTCPICGLVFLEDPYPLIVRLPCHPSHIYDLECIAPWLKLHATCPLDRVDLVRRREERGRVVGGKEEEEEGEEEWDGFYA